MFSRLPLGVIRHRPVVAGAFITYAGPLRRMRGDFVLFATVADAKRRFIGTLCLLRESWPRAVSFLGLVLRLVEQIIDHSLTMDYEGNPGIADNVKKAPIDRQALPPWVNRALVALSAPCPVLCRERPNCGHFGSAASCHVRTDRWDYFKSTKTLLNSGSCSLCFSCWNSNSLNGPLTETGITMSHSFAFRVI